MWKVRPHGEWATISERIRTITGDLKMPLTTLQRRMVAVRLRDGRLAIYNAIALDDEKMRALESFGTPAFLIVPNHMHRTDAAAWKKRYPEITVVAPEGARAAVEEVVAVDMCRPDFGDTSVQMVEVAGTDRRECALEVHENGRVSLLFTDVIGHLPRSDGLVLRLLGFAGDKPRVPRAVKKMLISDRAALKRQLEAWASPALERILVAHGQPILSRADVALRDVAAAL